MWLHINEDVKLRWTIRTGSILVENHPRFAVSTWIVWTDGCPLLTVKSGHFDIHCHQNLNRHAVSFVVQITLQFDMLPVLRVNESYTCIFDTVNVSSKAIYSYNKLVCPFNSSAQLSPPSFEGKFSHTSINGWSGSGIIASTTAFHKH